MDDAAIDVVRRFNRTVTERVGALRDGFLARERALGEARLLWEIGPEGRELRGLRTALNLDSGYLSRMLRSLEAAGLALVEPLPSDKRVRIARLTAAGLAERTILDRRSDDLAASILEPLAAAQRDRLLAAMADVERLLTASLVKIAPADPQHPQASYCIEQYFTELGRRFEGGFDPALSISADPDELKPPAGLMLVATLRSEAIGCGALKFHSGAPTEIKRMWVAETARGLGLGRRLLAELEHRACLEVGGDCTVRLETNETLVEAIAMYRSAGYVEVPAFNDEPYAHHWFEKHLRR